MLDSHLEIWYKEAELQYYDLESSASMPDWIYVDGERQQYLDQMYTIFLRSMY